MEIEDKLSSGLAGEQVDAVLEEIKQRYAELDEADKAEDEFVGKRETSSKMSSTDAKIYMLYKDLQQMTKDNAREIGIVNDRMNELESQLEEAADLMGAMENNAIAAVQEATEALGNKLLGSGFKPGGKKRLPVLRKRRGRKAAKASLAAESTNSSR